jgi:pyridoxamine 5'-phosphate oxidase
MMEVNEARRLSIELMEISKAAFLTTIDANGFPHTRGMTNMRNKNTHPHLIPLFRDQSDDFLILFSTNTSSDKVKHVKENPKVAVYYSHPEKTQGVMFGGEIEIVLDPKLKLAIWTDDMVKYYPSGNDDPDHTILRLHPRMAKGWNGPKFTTFAFNIR